MLICYVYGSFACSEIPKSRSTIFRSAQEKISIRADGKGVYLLIVTFESGGTVFVPNVPHFDHGIIAAANQFMRFFWVDSETVD